LAVGDIAIAAAVPALIVLEEVVIFLQHPLSR
jgi:hypothetical protein